MININNQDITKIYYQGYQILKAFACGGSLVFQSYKLRARYSDDSELIVPYDGNPVLTTSNTKSVRHDYYEMTEAEVSDNITSIQDGAFSECNKLSAVTIADSVTSIGGSTFNGCLRLETVNIPTGVTVIGNNTFYSCYKLTGITIPNGVTSIGNRTFWDCRSMTGNLNIPDSVSTIGEYAFRGCSGLTSVTIGNGITSINNWAFGDCSSLTSVTITATTPPTLASYNAFDSTTRYPIYVPAQSVNAYKTATNWSNIASRIQPIA